MTTETVNSFIDALAIRLAVPAAKLWETIPVLGMKSVVTVILGTISLILALLLYKISIKVWKSLNADDFMSFSLFIGAAFCLLAIGLICMGELPSVILWFYNPEAWTIDYLLSTLK